MRRGVALAVVIGVLVALSVDVAHAAPTSKLTRAELKIACDQAGGELIVTDNGIYGCFFPDGTLIVCGGSPNKCDYISRKAGGIQQMLAAIIASQSKILTQQKVTIAGLGDIRADIEDLRILADDARSACAPPDLIPVAIEGSDPPGFCRTDGGPNLIVRVRNQGMSEAPASTLRVTFTTPTGSVVVNAPTPVLTWGGGTADVPVLIPTNCFGPYPPETTIGACNFQIAVDAASVVAESNEPNNNVAGACVPVL